VLFGAIVVQKHPLAIGLVAQNRASAEDRILQPLPPHPEDDVAGREANGREGHFLHRWGEAVLHGISKNGVD